MSFIDKYVQQGVEICQGYITARKQEVGLATKLFELVSNMVEAVSTLGVDEEEVLGRSQLEVAKLIFQIQSLVSAELVELSIMQGGSGEINLREELPGWASVKSTLLQGLEQGVDPREHATFNQYKKAKLTAAKEKKANEKKEKAEAAKNSSANAVDEAMVETLENVLKIGNESLSPLAAKLNSLMGKVSELEESNPQSAKKLVDNFERILDQQLSISNKGGRVRAAC